MILGITGTIGSGKSAAAGIFEKYGFKVINADMGKLQKNLEKKS